MRHHNDGTPFTLVQIVQNVNHLAAGAGVQVAGRFVSQHNGRVVDQGAGNGNALLLPTRQFGGLVVQPIPQPYQFQQPLRPPLPFGSIHAGKNQGELDVLDGGHSGNQVKALENKANFVLAKFGKLVFIKLADVGILDPNAPPGGVI